MSDNLVTERTFRRTAWSIWAVSLTLLSSGLILLTLGAVTGRAALPEAPGSAQVFLIFCLQIVIATLGAVIVSGHTRNPIGWIFVAVGLLIGLGGMAGSYVSFDSASLPGADMAAWFSNLASGPILFGAFVFTFLLFPSGHLLSSRWRSIAWIAAAALVLVTLSDATLPGPLRSYSSIQNSLGISPLDSVLRAIFVGAFWIELLTLVASVVSLVVRFRRSQGEERQQLNWVVCATVLATILLLSGPFFWFVLPPPLGQWWPAAFFLAVAVIPASIGAAMLKYRLYDIDVILNRTLVYSALTVGIVGFYVLVVGGLGAVLQSRGNLLLSLLATGLVAVLFQPLREQLQRHVNRLTYGQRDEPYAVVSRLGRQLEATLAPDAVLPTIVTTVAEALRLPHVAIALRADDDFSVEASVGEPTADMLILPLLYQAEVVGHLILGRRPGETEFSAADRRLLDDLARQASVATHAVRLTSDLQRSRERLVLAREEERRRLRRDLHDELGPALATMVMQCETARDLLVSEPTMANILLSDLTEQLQAATADIRRLVHALRPPALDDLGLLGAVRNQIVQFERSGLWITLDVSQSLPPLPAAAEVAAYRITLEALNNVARHAEAVHCHVKFALDRSVGLLCVEITDDGKGLPDRRQAGVGLSSMRERAAELGGVCVIERREEGGTRVHATLPVSLNGHQPAGSE